MAKMIEYIGALPWVKIFTSFALGLLVVLAWQIDRYIPNASCRWRYIAVPCAFASLAICGIAIAPAGFFSLELIAFGFYTTTAVLLAATTWYLVFSKAAKTLLVTSTIALVVALLFTDLIVAGAVIHNDMPTKIAGPLYPLYLVFTLACVVAQVKGERTLLARIDDPCERNRAKYSIAALTLNHIAAGLCVVSMLMPTPFVTAPTIFPFTAVTGLAIYFFSYYCRALPLVALQHSPDRLLHEEHEAALMLAMGQVVAKVPFDDVIEDLVADLEEDGLLPPPPKELLRIASVSGMRYSSELSSLAWNKGLESLVVALIQMQPFEQRQAPVFTFDGGKASYSDALWYSGKK